jgi:hypothetical protein
MVQGLTSAGVKPESHFTPETVNSGTCWRGALHLKSVATCLEGQAQSFRRTSSQDLGRAAAHNLVLSLKAFLTNLQIQPISHVH